MKNLVFLIMIPFALTVQANDNASMACQKYPTGIKKPWISASIESLSHMSLKLNLKIDIDSSDEYVRVFGGRDNEADLKKNCGTTKKVKVRWIDSRTATHHVGGHSSTFSAAYKICLFSVHGAVVDSIEICDWEVGD